MSIPLEIDQRIERLKTACIAYADAEADFFRADPNDPARRELDRLASAAADDLADAEVLLEQAIEGALRDAVK